MRISTSLEVSEKTGQDQIAWPLALLFFGSSLATVIFKTVVNAHSRGRSRNRLVRYSWDARWLAYEFCLVIILVGKNEEEKLSSVVYVVNSVII